MSTDEKPVRRVSSGVITNLQMTPVNVGCGYCPRGSSREKKELRVPCEAG
jgi:hypothetical protein